MAAAVAAAAAAADAALPLKPPLFRSTLRLACRREEAGFSLYGESRMLLSPLFRSTFVPEPERASLLFVVWEVRPALFGRQTVPPPQDAPLEAHAHLLPLAELALLGRSPLRRSPLPISSAGFLLSR